MAIAGRLASDVSVYAARAELLLTRGDVLAAYRLCTTIMRRDPLCTECMDVYLACLVELGKKNDLFEFGHRCDLCHATFGVGAWSVCVCVCDLPALCHCKPGAENPSGSCVVPAVWFAGIAEPPPPVLMVFSYQHGCA